MTRSCERPPPREGGLDLQAISPSQGPTQREKRGGRASRDKGNRLERTAQSPPAQWNYEPRRTEGDNVRTWLTAISREDWVNEWTIEFIASLLQRRSLDLSKRQLACMDRIIHEAFDRGMRAIECGNDLDLSRAFDSSVKHFCAVAANLKDLAVAVEERRRTC